MNEFWSSIAGEIVKGLLVIAGSGLVSYLTSRANLKRVPSQNASDDASAVKDYAEAAKTALEEKELLRKELEEERTRTRSDIAALRQEVQNLRIQIDESQRTISRLWHIISDYQDWIVRLIHQIKSHGIDEPVPFRSSYPDVDVSEMSSFAKGGDATDSSVSPLSNSKQGE